MNFFFNNIIILTVFLFSSIIFLAVFSIYSNQKIRELIKLYLIIAVISFITILPIRIILNISGLLSISILSIIASVSIGRIFNSIFKNKELPSVYAIFRSICFSFILISTVYPIINLFIDSFFELKYFKDYFYLFIFIYYSILDNGMTDSILLAGRSLETEAILRSKRKTAENNDYHLKKAYDKYKKEMDSLEKRGKLRKFLDLFKKQRDLTKEIDAIAENNSSSKAFKGKSYSQFVIDLISKKK